MLTRWCSLDSAVEAAVPIWNTRLLSALVVIKSHGPSTRQTAPPFTNKRSLQNKRKNPTNESKFPAVPTVTWKLAARSSSACPSTATAPTDVKDCEEP